MEKELVYKKGYHLKVVSWENDADNYRTKFVHYESKEKAQMVQTVCLDLFKSCNNGDGGIGNSCNHHLSRATITTENFIEKNPEISKALGLTLEHDEYCEEDMMTDTVLDLAYSLMGWSEWYLARVCESATLYYVPEDLYIEVV